MNKKQVRLKRAKRARSKIREMNVHRLCVLRSNYHMYAQLISPCGSKVLATASTLDESIKSSSKYTGNQAAAALVGEMIAKRAKEQGIDKVAFDRSGFKFHGRVKALADAARESGLEF